MAIRCAETPIFAGSLTLRLLSGAAFSAGSLGGIWQTLGYLQVVAKAMALYGNA
jgi:hypothetical protein